MPTSKNKKYNRTKIKKKKQERASQEDPLMLKVFDSTGQKLYYQASMRRGHLVSMFRLLSTRPNTSDTVQLCVDLPFRKKGLPIADGIRVVLGGNVVYTSPVSWIGGVIHDDPIVFSIMYHPENMEGHVEILALLFTIESIPNVMRYLFPDEDLSQKEDTIGDNNSISFITGDPGITIDYDFTLMVACKNVDTRAQTHH